MLIYAPMPVPYPALSIVVVAIPMFQALKLGFPNSISGRFSAVHCRVPKFSVPSYLNITMAPKRHRSSSQSSATQNSENTASTDVPKLRTNASKTSDGVVVDDEPAVFDEMTLQEMKSSISNGVAANGNSKRKAKGISESDHMQTSNKGSPNSGGKRRTRKDKQSPAEDSADIESLQRATEQELSVESTEMEVKKKVSSRITTTNAKARVSIGDSVEEPWTVLTHKKPQKGWTGYNPKTMRPPSIAADIPHIKLLSWNVNGLRALLKSESFSALQLAQRENFDILCLQETKLQEKGVDAIRQTLLEGYDNSYWTCSVTKLGYSGTAIISRIKPLSVTYGLGISDHDSEGRLVTVEFDNFYLLNTYVPNSGDGLRRLSYRITEWDTSLSNYMKELEKSKPVILTGDLNCAHQEIDIFNPAGNKRSAGFTDEERNSFQTNFLDNGFVDTFRKQHPNVVGYTYWGYRHGGRRTNKGWRLDYFLASESIADQVYDSYILPDVGGSDHSPIGLILKL